MPGLGIFEHHTVRIKGIAGHHSQAVITVHKNQFPVLGSSLFYRNFSFTGNNLHLQFLFQVSVDGLLCDFFCQTGNSGFQEIVNVQNTELGIMIETPSSVFVADELAKLVDFFSVGTNDLTQYTLACDRQANDLGKFYDPHHPAVLRALKMATDAAHAAGIWIGICGELGADISMLPTFLAMGIDELSVSPSAVLPVRAAIRQSIAQTCTLEMLEC